MTNANDKSNATAAFQRLPHDLCSLLNYGGEMNAEQWNNLGAAWCSLLQPSSVEPDINTALSDKPPQPDQPSDESREERALRALDSINFCATPEISKQEIRDVLETIRSALAQKPATNDEAMNAKLTEELAVRSHPPTTNHFVYDTGQHNAYTRGFIAGLAMATTRHDDERSQANETIARLNNAISEQSDELFKLRQVIGLKTDGCYISREAADCLRNIINFYADFNNYRENNGGPGHETSPITRDVGMKANKALAIIDSALGEK